MSRRIVGLVSLLGFSLFAQEVPRKPSPFPEKNREREAAASARRASSRSGRPVRTKAVSPSAPSDKQTVAAAPAANTGKACFFAVKPDGEEISTDEFVAAHATYSLNSRVTVTNLANGKTVVVRITSRFSDPQRIISVSEAAARQLGFYTAGTADVKLDPIREDGPPAAR